ncbi:MAG: phospholipid carrier-dependent glycosyltransferase [Candidatus Promineifilaceae bacterium]|nr:phospholipid carrier-dependent glycosyltransferase [Candidatus Promineifilaceae bacterium]
MHDGGGAPGAFWRRWEWLLLALVLLVAAALRLTGVDWDGYHHYHPDERFITWVATTVEFPRSLATALIPAESSFNPYYWPPGAESPGIVVPADQPRYFAYGHLPLYLGVAATRFAEGVAPLLRGWFPEGWLFTQDILNAAGHTEFRHLTAVVRVTTALVDVMTVAAVFFLGRRLYGIVVGLLAAALLALNVMHIQLAHFFAVDPYLTLFTVLALLFVVLAAGREQADRAGMALFLLAGAAIGLAVGSKFSAVLLFLPLGVALLYRWHWREAVYWQRLVLSGAAALIAFAVTNPFALLAWNCSVVTPARPLGPLSLPALDWRSCFLDNIARQSAMVQGGAAFPFTRQYLETVPYLYPVLMQIRWGMGPLLGVTAFGGFAWAIWVGARAALRWRPNRPGIAPVTASGQGGWLAGAPLGWIVLAWTVPYFLITGGFVVKFMRYMQPLTPFLMIYAAAFLLALPWVRLRRILAAVVLVGTALYALAFVNLYTTVHPWMGASHWIYENVESGALILSEKWDDPLPSSLEVDGEFRRHNEFESDELAWLTGSGAEDDLAKLEENLALLAAADYVAISSNRNYGVVARLADHYPLSSQYHALLFAGALGYETVYVAGRSPEIAGVALWPQRFARAGVTPPDAVAAYLDQQARISLGFADESFTVYDQPLVMIFKNTSRLSAEEMRQRFVLE